MKNTPTQPPLDCPTCGGPMPVSPGICPHCGADIDASTGEITYAGCWFTPVLRGE